MTPPYQASGVKVAVLILNYNGAELLRNYLPSFQKAARASTYSCRLAVIDNASSDASAEILKNNFPDVAVHALSANKVLCAYNEVAAKLTDDILIFMNNDIRVEESFVDPLVAPFLRDEKVFFVTPKCLAADGRYEGNKTRGRMRFGVYWSTALFPGYQSQIDRPGSTLHGGFGAFDRRKFLEINGYDDLYLPGRLEDADLCFRAYKREWRCLYEPASVVFHEGGMSFHKVFGPRRTLVINWRNTFLFMWKNLSDRLLILKAIFWLPARLLWSLISGKTELFFGFLEALPLYGEARKRREVLKRSGFFKSVPDRKIFAEV